MELNPKKRICPSESCIRRRKVSRQALGARNGNKPPITSIRAKAISRVVPIAHHFFAAGALPVASRR